MKAVSREPMIRPKGALALQGGEEVGLERVPDWASRGINIAVSVAAIVLLALQALGLTH